MLRSDFAAAEPTRTVDCDCVVFSRDRPMQLDACLRSIARHAPYRGTITVVYRATTDRFRRGYARLETSAGVRLLEQGEDFKADVLGVLDQAGELIVFHTDDDLFFRTPPRAPLLPDGCAAFSLRLGRNTTYCYPFARDQRVPDVESSDGIMAWNWRLAELDFAYPMSLDGHVMDTDLIRGLARTCAFRDPNELERELHLRRHRAPRLLAAFDESCIVAVPLNVVTESMSNRSGADPELTPEALNERYLAGERIDLDALDFTAIRAAHQEIPLAFSRAQPGGG
jgi:hypothetical protein